jgi:hypothetical protein
MPNIKIMTLDPIKVKKYNLALRGKSGTVFLDQKIAVIITDVCPAANLVP